MYENRCTRRLTASDSDMTRESPARRWGHLVREDARHLTRVEVPQEAVGHRQRRVVRAADHERVRHGSGDVVQLRRGAEPRTFAEHRHHPVELRRRCVGERSGAVHRQHPRGRDPGAGEEQRHPEDEGPHERSSSEDQPRHHDEGHHHPGHQQQALEDVAGPLPTPHPVVDAPSPTRPGSTATLGGRTAVHHHSSVVGVRHSTPNSIPQNMSRWTPSFRYQGGASRAGPAP